MYMICNITCHRNWIDKGVFFKILQALAFANNEMPSAIIFRKDIFDGNSTEDTRSSNFNASIVSTLSNKVAIKINEIWLMLSF